jgi:hypothetical protein
MIFGIGSKHGDVEKIQARLKSLGYLAAEPDGIYGIDTKTAVLKYQTDIGLNADGIVGPKTWAKLFPIERPSLPMLAVPESKEQLIEIFGDPLMAGHWEAYGGFCETPPELDHIFVSKWDGRNGFWCHKLLIPVFQRVYANIVKEGLATDLYSFDGCHVVRYKRGGTSLSMHSWGIAVDHNAKTNPLGSKGDMNPRIVKAFKVEEFYHGGSFKTPDPMHFEFTRAGL